jgi:hypothetical protein
VTLFLALAAVVDAGVSDHVAAVGDVAVVEDVVVVEAFVISLSVLNLFP